MSTRWLVIQLEEPLLLGQAKPDTKFLSTLGYIPGRILRGAWADWLIVQGRESQIPTVVQGVRIGNFLPVAEWRPVIFVSPSLLSMLTCKREGGFSSEPVGQDEAGHGVVDTLVPGLAYHLLQQAGANFPVPFTITCNKCESRMEQASGFFSLYRDGAARRYVRTRPKYYTHTRVTLSRYRRAAEEGMLYSATALSPKTSQPDSRRKKANLVFIGRVEGPDDKVDQLIQALNAVPIGAMRTRGYGRIEVETGEMRLSSVSERVEEFNRLLAECWRDLKRLAANASALPDRPDTVYFSVDLLSPAIFHDRGMPSLVPGLEVAGQSLQSIFWLTRPDFAAGWSDAWGLPKPTALAARMGSTYVFRWDRPPDNVFIAALERLEAEGIGERRDESFGECWVCHPFHQEVNEK